MSAHSDMPEGDALLQTLKQRIRDLASMPLFQGMPADVLHLLARSIPPAQHFTPGDVIIRQGDKGENSNFLYIVGEGRLRQSGEAPDGIPWLERILQRGDTFGRYTLFTGKPQETTVEAVESGYFYRVPADLLREILERWPPLQSRLIPEERIQRLRGIPLYGALPDHHIRRLADHIVEKRLAPDELLQKTVAHTPTVWVIVEGQGAISPLGEEPPSRFWDAPPLSLSLVTVGYAFIDAAGGGFPRPPEQLRAVSDVLLYGLPLLKFNELVERFAPPVLGEERPPHPFFAHLYPPRAPELLRRALDPEGNVPEALWPHLTGFVAWIFTPRFQTLTRQGETSGVFYLLVEGEAIVRAVDERGRRRPRNYVFPGQSFGRTSLLTGAVHDATMETTQPSYWLRLTRDDLSRFNRYFMLAQPSPVLSWARGLTCLLMRLMGLVWGAARQAVQEQCRPWTSIWRYLGGRPPLAERLVGKRAGWKDPDEHILWFDRKHIYFFLLSIMTPLLLLSVALAFFVLSLMGRASPLAREFSLMLSLLLALWVFYRLYDYVNDFYAITDRRVIHREQLVPIRDVWEEVPLERIQDLNLRRGFFGKFLNYGTVAVQTAAPQGGIVMHNIPDPDGVYNLLNRARSRVGARARARQRERLREDLQQRLYVNLLAEWSPVATGKVYPLDRVHREEQASTPRRGGALHIPWTPKMFWRAGNTYYWRKHYVRLFLRIALPLILVLIGLILFVLAISMRSLIMDVHPSAWYGLMLALSLFFFFSVALLVWRYDDWRNDLYILMPDRIIDLEKKPFFMEEERREATLDRVQDTRVERKGPFAYIFNYGTVIVQTAAQEGELRFRYVADPLGVARHIAEAREAYQRRRERQEMERQQALFAESIEVYDELVRGRLPRIRREWRRDDL